MSGDVTLRYVLRDAPISLLQAYDRLCKQSANQVYADPRYDMMESGCYRCLFRLYFDEVLDRLGIKFEPAHGDYIWQEAVLEFPDEATLLAFVMAV